MTPRAPSFEAELAELSRSSRHEFASRAWRAVEAQHVVSTLRLTGSDPEQQELLERILDESKPPVPAEASRLHYLLATPYRYPPAALGSRFRTWPEPGVLYSAFEKRTACAELGYWRWRFLTDSSGLAEIAASPQTLFQLAAAGQAIDLRTEPFAARARFWTDPADYSATQALGRAARAAGVELIVYESVRDPERGGCMAVLHPGTLHPARPLSQETWHLTVTAAGAIWQRERRRFVFRYA